MCGRTGCTLCPDDLRKACSYRRRGSGKFEKPMWSEASSDVLQYKPSYNMCPTDVAPVVVAGTHFETETERVIQPMLWGMIPVWHKGDYKSHGLSTTNCRVEGLTTSKLYSRPLKNGNRCIVVCEGFYEWQTTKGKGNKQPYFIYMPQKDGTHIEDCNTWTSDWDEDEGWKGPKLLNMAGLFDIWKSPEGEVYYSYSVITMESNETLSWLAPSSNTSYSGDRRTNSRRAAGQTTRKGGGSYPALSQSTDQLKMEKNFSETSTVLNNRDGLIQKVSHPVRHVHCFNQSRCCPGIQSQHCKPKVTNKSQQFMSAWLKKGTSPVKREPKEDSTDVDASVTKKIKKEENSK